MISRRCLICSNINPCREHSEEVQQAELDRNTREFDRIIRERKLQARRAAIAGEKG